MRAVLTRDDDFFIPLGKRPRLAREMGADIFISLHADTYKDSKISGASFYVMSWNGATSQLAKFVAAHSNSADSQSSGLEPWNEKLANQIGKLAMQSSIDDSRKLADFMQKGLKKTGIKLQHNHVQAANFVVLKNIDMPSVLVEMGFISNPQQDKLLQDTQYQQKMAASITKGLVGFVQVQPEPGVVYAKLNVVKGDSLASIAERHGTSIAYLARANSLTEKSTLKVGQQLRVPVAVSRRMAMLSDDRS
jgi:N-acetylmuramoyl-L-alanine amidase